MRVLTSSRSVTVVGHEWAHHSEPTHELAREPPDVLRFGGRALLSRELPPRLVPLPAFGPSTVQPLVEAPGQADGEGVDVDAPFVEPFGQEFLLREDVVLLVGLVRTLDAIVAVRLLGEPLLLPLPPVVPGNFED